MDEQKQDKTRGATDNILNHIFNETLITDLAEPFLFVNSCWLIFFDWSIFFCIRSRPALQECSWILFEVLVDRKTHLHFLY